MRNFLIATMALLLIGTARPAQAGVALDWDPAFFWQPGATPTNAPLGGELKVVGVISGFGPPLDSLDATNPAVEYTFYMYGLISQGTVAVGPPATQFYTTQYSGGVIEVYSDNTPEHSFTPNPPNADVPSTFVDGELILSGTISGFITETNNFTMFQIGHSEGQISWTGGSLLAKWQNNRGDPCPGLFTGGLTWRAGTTPAGYLFRHDGKLDFNCFHVADMDIHPTSCPNPLNTTSNGLTSVALLGSPTFDLSKVELGSILLQGVAPVRMAIEDVSRPVEDRLDVCDCTTLGPDGYDDLVLKFRTKDLIATLGAVQDKETRVLTMTGNLFFSGATQAFIAQDCIKINANTSTAPAPSVALQVSSEDDLDRAARITYAVPQLTRVRITVHDLGGRTVGRLVNDMVGAGEHELRWAPSSLPSGMYFVRMEAGGEETLVRRFVLRR